MEKRPRLRPPHGVGVNIISNQIEMLQVECRQHRDVCLTYQVRHELYNQFSKYRQPNRDDCLAHTNNRMSTS
jgi:hypothetical protein